MCACACVVCVCCVCVLCHTVYLRLTQSHVQTHIHLIIHTDSPPLTHTRHPQHSPIHDTHSTHPFTTPTALTRTRHPQHSPVHDTHSTHPYTTPTALTHTRHPQHSPVHDTHSTHPYTTPTALTRTRHPQHSCSLSWLTLFLLPFYNIIIGLRDDVGHLGLATSHSGTKLILHT